MAESETARAHLNLIESSRRLFGLDPGAVVEAGNGALLGAGSPPHPMISNAALRTDDGLEPAAFIERAREFFGAKERGFVVWARAGTEEDTELIRAAEGAGFQNAYEMPEMILGRRAEEPLLPEGVEIRRLGSAQDAEHYWQVAGAAYASIGFPPGVFGFYEGLEDLDGDDAAAFLADLDGEPVAIAMTIVNHGVAGIYWVGSLERARGRGIGRAITAAATNARPRARRRSSPPCRPRRWAGPSTEAMGYETIYDYRLLLSPAPGS